MAIGSIRSLGSIDPRAVYSGQAPVRPQASFAERLNAAVDSVDRAQERRDELVTEMVRGEQVEVHDVMTAAEEAQLAFDLLLEVRNKLLESYQEIMRMQV